MKTKRVAYDNGRIDADINPEGLVYCQLHQHNASNIATVGASGDVVRKTAAQPLTEKVKDKTTHSMLMLKGVGISLNLFSSTRQLVTTVRDCIKGTTLFIVR